MTVFVTGFIFSNSLKGPDASNESSGFFLRLLEPVTNFLDKYIPDADWNFIIRKGAHFTEFCILGILSSNMLLSIDKRKIKSFLGYNFFLVLSVAVTDEFIQSFTGRTSSVRDVLLDFCGAFVGILAVIIISNIKNGDKYGDQKGLFGRKLSK